MTLRTLIILTAVILSGCASATTECLNELDLEQFDHKFEFGRWHSIKIPNSSWQACLPASHNFKLIETIPMATVLEKPTTGVLLSIPSDNEKIWLTPQISEIPHMYVFFMPLKENWNGSLMDWVNHKFSGTYNGKCVSSNTTPENYPSPYFIKFLTPIIPLTHIEGEAIQFTACREYGTWYAVRTERQITLVGYWHGFERENIQGEKLLRRLIENLKMDSSAD